MSNKINTTGSFLNSGPKTEQEIKRPNPTSLAFNDVLPNQDSNTPKSLSPRTIGEEQHIITDPTATKANSATKSALSISSEQSAPTPIKELGNKLLLHFEKYELIEYSILTGLIEETKQEPYLHSKDSGGLGISSTLGKKSDKCFESKKAKYNLLLKIKEEEIEQNPTSNDMEYNKRIRSAEKKFNKQITEKKVQAGFSDENRSKDSLSLYLFTSTFDNTNLLTEALMLFKDDPTTYIKQLSELPNQKVARTLDRLIELGCILEGEKPIPSEIAQWRKETDARFEKSMLIRSMAQELMNGMQNCSQLFDTTKRIANAAVRQPEKTLVDTIQSVLETSQKAVENLQTEHDANGSEPSPDWIEKLKQFSDHCGNCICLIKAANTHSKNLEELGNLAQNNPKEYLEILSSFDNQLARSIDQLVIAHLKTDASDSQEINAWRGTKTRRQPPAIPPEKKKSAQTVPPVANVQKPFFNRATAAVFGMPSLKGYDGHDEL